MSQIFNGKAFVEERLKLLSNRVTKLQRKGTTPRLVSIIVGDNPVGLFYANLKKKIAERIGISVNLITLFATIDGGRFELRR